MTTIVSLGEAHWKVEEFTCYALFDQLFKKISIFRNLDVQNAKQDIHLYDPFFIVFLLSSYYLKNHHYKTQNTRFS